MKSYNVIILLCIILQSGCSFEKVSANVYTKKTCITNVQVDPYIFPAAVKAPGSFGTVFLGGAGVRGLAVKGKYMNFTAIGIYLGGISVPLLAHKWRGKTVQELTSSEDFFKDIVEGPFEKFTWVRMILPLTGKQFSEKVVENCIALWKAEGIYTNEEKEATKKFLEVFKNENFPPGAGVLFTHSRLGSLIISFSKDGSLPEYGNAVIFNRQLSEAIPELIIGKNGISPAAKQSLAARLGDLINGKCIT